MWVQAKRGALDLKMHPILLWTDEQTDQHTKEVRRLRLAVPELQGEQDKTKEPTLLPGP